MPRRNDDGSGRNSWPLQIAGERRLWDMQLTCRFELDSATNLPRRSTGSAQLPVIVQATGQAARMFCYARFQP
jgi:hypothetical protein